MTLIQLEVGKSDYSRGWGIQATFFSFRVSFWRVAGKWRTNGSLWYNWPPLTWRLGYAS